MLKNLSPEERRSEETTIISAGVKIEGKVKSNGNIRVEGQIEGDIESRGSVVIGGNGEVNGQISAELISIAGSVTGINLLLRKKEILKEIFLLNHSS